MKTKPLARDHFLFNYVYRRGKIFAVGTSYVYHCTKGRQHCALTDDTVTLFAKILVLMNSLCRMTQYDVNVNCVIN